MRCSPAWRVCFGGALRAPRHCGWRRVIAAEGRVVALRAQGKVHHTDRNVCATFRKERGLRPQRRGSSRTRQIFAQVGNRF